VKGPFRFVRDKIVAAYETLRDGPKIPGYPFTANWTLVSNFLFGIQSSINHGFRNRHK
jgi:hypothetical protein